MTASFDELVEKLNAEDWLVRDCYQTAPGRWIVTLHQVGKLSIAYGQGESALQAMHKAMSYLKLTGKQKRVPLR